MPSEVSWVEDMPAAYDELLGPVLFAPFAEVLARRVAALRPRRVLELAAGSGIATAAVRRALPEAAITATDLNPAMVACGAERVPDANWQQADAMHLPMPDASVDVVVCQFGVMFFPDKPAAFTEMCRVVAPGGHVVLLVWDVVEASQVPAALVDGLEAVFPDDSPTFVVRIPHGYADVEQIRADLSVGGLTCQSIDRVVLSSRAASATSLAQGFARGTPLRFELQQRGSLDDLADRLAEEMTRLLGEGPIEGDLAAFLVHATRPSGS
jgi:SAM-dependent methyltransferase